MRSVPPESFISIVPTADGADILPARLHLLSAMSETVTGRSLLLLPSRPSPYLLRQAKTWLALIACHCATRATDVPAPKISSTIRRFSSTDLRRLFTGVTVSIVLCSEVSIYPSWTLIDVPIHIRQHPYLLTLSPDGSDQALTTSPLSRSRQDLVEIIKGILKRHPPHAVKPSFRAHFLDLSLMKA
jgi:hypothetical protein